MVFQFAAINIFLSYGAAMVGVATAKSPGGKILSILAYEARLIPS